MIDAPLVLDVVSTGLLAEIARRIGAITTDVENVKRRVSGLEDEIWTEGGR